MESYTINELAEISGMSPHTIRRKIKQGEIRAQRVKRAYRVDQAEAQRYFQENAVETKKSKTMDKPGQPRGETPLDEAVIRELRERVASLESERDFLRTLVQRLQEDVRLLTIKQLPPVKPRRPPDGRDWAQRVRDFFTGRSE